VRDAGWVGEWRHANRVDHDVGDTGSQRPKGFSYGCKLEGDIADPVQGR